MEEHTSENQQPAIGDGLYPENPKNLRPSEPALSAAPAAAEGENLRSSQPDLSRPPARVEGAKKGPWGGRRPGAGPPKGNLNGFKHGGRSRQLAQAVKTLAENPKTREALVALARRAGLEQAKADEVAARFFINMITKGVKITNPEQAQAITDLIRELSR